MLIQIKASIITGNRKHTIVLPQNQEDFDETLTKLDIKTGDPSEYRICYVSSNLDGLNKLFVNAKDIEELNFLAQLLEGFSDREIRAYDRFFNPRIMSANMQNLINIAYSFYEFSYDFYDGRFFPAFDYETNYILKVTLSKYNENKGVNIILPASENVFNRALRKLGASGIEECFISKSASWHFSALENIDVSGENIFALNEWMKKLVQLPKYVTSAYFELMIDDNRIITINDLENFTNYKFFMPEAMRA